MDEKLINQTVEEYDVIIEPEDEVSIDISESMGWVSGDERYHDSLLGIEFPNQHPITAIKGLREELDKIEALKAVESDQFNVANYYKIADANVQVGRFVSLEQSEQGETSVILCNGTTPIFGVTVESAGFVGGQDKDFPRDESFILVVTSGLVNVQCASDVAVGDYVVADKDGKATTAQASKCGYKVVATKNPGVPYASIALGVQADVTDWLQHKTQSIDEQLRVIDTNLNTAMNTANDAYQKATNTDKSNADISSTVDEMMGVVNGNKTEVDKAVSVSEQAKAVADAAVLEAIRSENKANDAWIKAENLKDDEYSLRANIDKYSVGEYSQVYRLTWEQAIGILKDGMIYTPAKEGMGEGYIHTEEYPYTNHPEYIKEWSDEFKSNADTTKVYYVTKTEENAETNEQTEVTTYYYCELGEWKESATIPTYSTEFISGFLYRWDLIDGKYKWITVDKYYRPENDINFSGQAVKLVDTEPTVLENDTWGYWYTNSDTIKDKDGNTGVYSSYTLYHCKWIEEDKRVDGEKNYSWIPVATLAGNVNNRIMNATTLTANEAATEIINARGSAASLGARITDTEAAVEMVAKWAIDEDTYNIAGMRADASADEGALTLFAMNKNGDKVIRGASIELGTNDADSRIVLNADQIKFVGESIFTETDEDGASKTVINGDSITTGAITSQNYVDSDGEEGSKLDLTDGSFDSKNFKVTAEGAMTATEGDIAGWKIAEKSLSKDYTRLLADDSVMGDSLVIDGATSPVRIAVGRSIKTEQIEEVLGFYDGYADEHIHLGVELIGVNITCDDPANPYLTFRIAEDGKSVYIDGDAGGPYTNDVPVTIEYTYYTNSPATRILDDGSFYTSAADIKGTITAEKGEIGGWQITETGLKKDATQLLADDSIVDQSLVNEGKTSPVRIRVGHSHTETETHETVVTVWCEGAYIKNAFVGFDEELIDVEIISDEDEDGNANQGNWLTPRIADGGVYFDGQYSQGYEGYVYVTIKYTCYAPITKILEDGSLYSSAIKATGGTIGGFTITGNTIEASGWENENPLTLNIVSDGTITSTGAYTKTQLAGGSISVSASVEDVSINIGAGSINCAYNASLVWELSNTAATFDVRVNLKNGIYVYDSENQTYAQGVTATIGNARFVNGILVEVMGS